MKVFIAMSGGVDSSVAAALLKKQGHDVLGVFMQGWNNPNFECTWRSDRQDAARVAAKLGIPFKVLDYSREYYEKVVSYLISEYKAGRTPNPDVMCNKEIKFGLFYNWALERGADYIATGHYAISDNGKLYASKDKDKDQTYFLWTLSSEIVARSIFPIGALTKPEVRDIASQFGLHTARKKDSQGICFVGKGSVANFLKENMKTTPGDVVTSDGKKIGEHDGLELYTLGQRRGLGVAGGYGVYYVAQKDFKTHSLVVAESKNTQPLYYTRVAFTSSNWLRPVSFPFECEARIRYREPLTKCYVNDGVAKLETPQKAVAAGQSVVFYKDDKVLGGGIIN
jgi:tRNA-uridine 2-sulfurtransferase